MRRSEGITAEGELTLSGIQIIGDAEEGKKKSNLEATEAMTLTVMKGLAVFKDGKLKDWMDGSEARGTQWVLNKIKIATLNIDADDQKEALAIDITLSKTKTRVELREGVPVFHIEIKEEGFINETKVPIDFSKREELLKLEKAIAKKTEEEVMMSIKTAQSLNCDIFGFADQLKRTDPKAWSTVKNEWDTLFAKGKTDLSVEAHIRSTGMRIKSYMSKPEE